ncbi:Protein of unknown function [Ornithinibacillus halophilus]|uniref:DUF2953 domain-containing protein n=2 Tax=Ornithinibacillus halophilus TaxID=930117 RepID=A0A1M5EJP5_9BACI|nr:Protein of unknown function [Ornithinibacillus halophilus]
MVWMIIGLILFLLLFIIVMSKVNLILHYSYNNHIHCISVAIRLYGIQLLSIERKYENNREKDWLDTLMEIDIQEEVQSFQTDLKTFKHWMKQGTKLFKEAMQQINIKKLDWKTAIGTGDASSTGIVTGSLWMVKGTIIGALHEITNLNKQPSIEMIPNFQQKLLQSKIDCIVSIRIGKAIYMFLKVMRNFPVKKEAYI